MTDEQRERSPEILDVEAEREILFQRLTDRVERALEYGCDTELPLRDASLAIAAAAATAALRELRVMSARQMAVLLAAEANRHVGYVIREPPHYSAEEIADAT